MGGVFDFDLFSSVYRCYSWNVHCTLPRTTVAKMINPPQGAYAIAPGQSSSATPPRLGTANCRNVARW